MRRVVIESPLRAQPYTGLFCWLPLVKRMVEFRRYARNRRYARACMRDSLCKGEAPFASHLLYDQRGILDDTLPEERELGIAAGFHWGSQATLVAVYGDYGVSTGMLRGISRAAAGGTPWEMRSLGPDWDNELAPLQAGTATSTCSLARSSARQRGGFGDGR